MLKEKGSTNCDTVRISARIPAELGEMLSRVSRTEERSKSYYVRKSLELFLTSRPEDIEDYEEAQRSYREFVVSGENLFLFPK